MVKYTVKRLLFFIPTLLGLSFLSFILIRLIPGDPVLMMLGERGGSPEAYAEMKAALGLDKSLLSQYFIFLKDILTGDLGNSIFSKQSVLSEFIARFPATAELSLIAITWATLVGVVLGVIAALNRNKFIDRFVMTLSLVGYSMPIFWWGLLLILTFSIWFDLTPVSGRISVEYDIDTITGFYLIDSWFAEDGFNAFLSSLKHLILPAFVLGTVPMASISRMTRASVLEVLNQDYIRTARAKGLSKYVVVFKHALKNALIPIITVIGLMVGTLLTGAILTETIFAWPGLGRWLVASLLQRDYPVIQGGILLIASLILIVNLVVDLLYFVVNPQMQKGEL